MISSVGSFTTIDHINWAWAGKPSQAKTELGTAQSQLVKLIFPFRKRPSVFKTRDFSQYLILWKSKILNLYQTMRIHLQDSHIVSFSDNYDLKMEVKHRSSVINFLMIIHAYIYRFHFNISSWKGYLQNLAYSFHWLSQWIGPSGCMRRHGTRCPLLTAFYFFLSLCRVTFLQEGVIVGFRNFAWSFKSHKKSDLG